MGRVYDSGDSYVDIYLRYRDPVFRYVRRVTRNEDLAEDLTQDVFFLAYEKWDLVALHPNVPGFLMRSASNMMKKWYRQQRRFVVDEEELNASLLREESETEWASPYDMVDFYRSVETILSGEELLILRYYYEYGYTSAEMAQMLGVTVSCFKVRVARMRDKIRKHLRIVWTVVYVAGKWEWVIVWLLVR